MKKLKGKQNVILNNYACRVVMMPRTGPGLLTIWIHGEHETPGEFSFYVYMKLNALHTDDTVMFVPKAVYDDMTEELGDTGTIFETIPHQQFTINKWGDIMAFYVDQVVDRAEAGIAAQEVAPDKGQLN